MEKVVKFRFEHNVREWDLKDTLDMREASSNHRRWILTDIYRLLVTTVLRLLARRVWTREYPTQHSIAELPFN
jgi:hypothetical protein